MKQVIINSVLTAIAYYILIGYAALKLNIFTWSEEQRVFHVVVVIATIILTIVAKENKEKTK